MRGRYYSEAGCPELLPRRAKMTLCIVKLCCMGHGRIISSGDPNFDDFTLFCILNSYILGHSKIILFHDPRNACFSQSSCEIAGWV